MMLPCVMKPKPLEVLLRRVLLIVFLLILPACSCLAVSDASPWEDPKTGDLWQPVRGDMTWGRAQFEGCRRFGQYWSRPTLKEVELAFSHGLPYRGHFWTADQIRIDKGDDYDYYGIAAEIGEKLSDDSYPKEDEFTTLCLLKAGNAVALDCRSDGHALVSSASGGCLQNDLGIVWGPYSAERQTYKQARQFCEDLVVVYYEDWVLPDVYYLRRLQRLDIARKYLSLPFDFFWPSENTKAFDLIGGEQSSPFGSARRARTVCIREDIYNSPRFIPYEFTDPMPDFAKHALKKVHALAARKKDGIVTIDELEAVLDKKMTPPHLRWDLARFGSLINYFLHQNEPQTMGEIVTAMNGRPNSPDFEERDLSAINLGGQYGSFPLKRVGLRIKLTFPSDFRQYINAQLSE